MKSVHECRQVRGEIIGTIAHRRATRIAMTSLSEGEGVDILGKIRQKEFESVP
jgi:hypothetical protein